MKQKAIDTGEMMTIRLKELRAEREKRLAAGFKSGRLRAGFNRQGRLVPVEKK